MNKKGFTLVELLAVIIIIAILSVAGYAVYNNIGNNIKQNDYDNIIKLIKTSAYDYFNNNDDQEYVFVDTLIKENYVYAENNKLIDPRDSETVLNCLLVTNEDGVINISENSYADNTGTCLFVNIAIKKDDKYEILNDNWINDDTVDLVLYDVINKEEIIGNYDWYLGDTYKTNGSDYALVEDYVGEVKVLYDYTVTGNIKRDNTPPTCISSDDRIDWTKDDVIVSYSCNDDLSGCKEGYSGGSINVNYSSISINVPSYTIMDNAGNSTTCDTKTVYTYVDKCDKGTEDITTCSGDTCTVTHKSTYGSKFTCSTESHNRCANANVVTDTTKCNAECDGGKYYQTKTSIYDGSSCGSGYTGGECNTQSCCTTYLINGVCYTYKESLLFYCKTTKTSYPIVEVYDMCNCTSQSSCGGCTGWSALGWGTAGWCCDYWWNDQSGNCCARHEEKKTTSYEYQSGKCKEGYEEADTSKRKCPSGYTYINGACYK